MEVLLFALFFIFALIFFIAGKDDFGRKEQKIESKEGDQVKNDLNSETKDDIKNTEVPKPTTETNIESNTEVPKPTTETNIESNTEAKTEKGTESSAEIETKSNTEPTIDVKKEPDSNN